jgi:hypothetical protein
MYLFTTPLHPAHPSFLVVTQSDNPSESVLSGSYAGSREEFENFFDALLARLRDRNR